MGERSRHIPMVEKAACLAGALFGIPYGHLKNMSALQVLSLLEFHHNIPHAPPYNGANTHWNLTAMLRRDHRVETVMMTIPAIAKGKRVLRANEDFVRKVLSKPCGHKRQRSGRIPARVNPWGKKGAQSR